VAKDMEEEQPDDLPAFVIINPSKGGMFMDPLSGLYLTQWPVEVDGVMKSNYGHVPKGKDTSRIKYALQANLLFPCNPKGECKHITKYEVVPNKLEGLMKSTVREIVATVEQLTDAITLKTMETWEMDKAPNKRRVTVLRAISNRLKSEYVQGIIGIDSRAAMIMDKETGKMVPDTITVR
jgi:hypothetical protein